MGIPVAELQQRMSSAEFAEWMAFYSLEPWGFRAEMYGEAQVACILANSSLCRGKDDPVHKIDEFLPHESEPQTPDEMLAFARMTTIAHGGEVRT
jgi:hypothetical protein